MPRKQQSETYSIPIFRGPVLLRSIQSGGSSISDYVAPDGQDGAYQDERRVYAREGLGCYECSSVIRKKFVAQRGTHYCPRCQK